MKLSNANEIVRLKGHINWKWMTLVKDIYHMDVVVHIICQKLYKIVFLSFKSHGYQLYNVHTHSSYAPPLSLGQKWQKNTFRPKKHFSWPMKWGSMHPCGLGFFFSWGGWWCWIFVVPNVFPSSSQHVPQVSNVFFNMFSIIHCFIPYPLP